VVESLGQLMSVSARLKHYALDFIERHFITRRVIELCRAGESTLSVVFVITFTRPRLGMKISADWDGGARIPAI
jgi:hypothetical protein